MGGFYPNRGRNGTFRIGMRLSWKYAIWNFPKGEIPSQIGSKPRSSSDKELE
jgi:hypothetical protein